MKKVLVIILILACCAGVGVLGYMVFRSRNVEAVAIEGQMQTLYLVNECSVPDYEDAKLKVTYKNGNIKYVSLTNKSVKVSDFSTSIKDHKTMKITYKSKTVSVEYDVVPAGLYYISGETIRSDNAIEENEEISLSTTTTMFYLGENGVLQYYRKLSAGWYLDDGYYDSNFYYEVSKDAITLYAGKDSNGKPVTTTIKPDYSSENGELRLISTVISYGTTGFPANETVRTYSNFLMKTNVSIRSIQLMNFGLVTEDPQIQESYVAIKRGKTLESDNHNIYISVQYESPLITFEDENEQVVDMLDRVYVRVTDKMVSSFSSSNITTEGVEHAYIIYNSWTDVAGNGVVLYYKIVE